MKYEREQDGIHEKKREQEEGEKEEVKREGYEKCGWDPCQLLEASEHACIVAVPIVC